MKTLISPRETLELAFPSSPGMSADSITEPIVISAQQKFISPALGALYARVEAGETPELLNNYIKPALAYYVKLLVLPVVAASVGQLGIVTHKSDSFAPAAPAVVAALKKRTRSEAAALMRCAIRHIESNPALYPEYDPRENVTRRVSISSDIVL